MGVMITSFPPHPNPLPPGEREIHSSPQQSWGVFWHILINPNIKPARGKALGASRNNPLRLAFHALTYLRIA